jgi:hypothetical protein
MFNYGKTRAQVTKMHPSSLDLRYFVFVIAFIVLISLYYISWKEINLFGEKLPLFVPNFLLGSYFSILGLAGLLVGYQTKKVKQGLYAPLVLFIQHLGFSLGLLFGFLKKS